ncbi:MAG: chaperonin GroEL [Bacteroidales bacterium]
MKRQLQFSREARNSLRKGIDLGARTVGISYGPNGRNVLIDNRSEKPQVLKNGSQVLKNLSRKDHYEDIGIKILKEVSLKTQKQTGDGSTTAVLLTAALIQNGIKLLHGGVNVNDLQTGLDHGLEVVCRNIRNKAIDIKQNEHFLEKLANTATYHDRELSGILIEAFKMTGHESLIITEKGKGTDTQLEIKEGMQFDRGYLSPYFITHLPKMKIELENPYILLYDEVIAEVKDVLPLLDRCHNENRSLLIVAKNVESYALATLILNKIRGTLKVAVVKTPYSGDTRTEMLEDIAACCGGILFTKEKGVLLSFIEKGMLGEADKVIVDQNNTCIINGRGSKRKINERIEQIRHQLSKPSLPKYNRKKLEKRLSKLLGLVAVIKVGAPTESEMKAKKNRVEISVNTIKAAFEEGITYGGGLAYLKSIHELNDLEKREINQDVSSGISILRNALKEPARVMINNSGTDASPIIEKLINKTNGNGYDVVTHQEVDFIEAAIIDPVKVLRVALENAVSVAGMFLKTETVISYAK